MTKCVLHLSRRGTLVNSMIGLMVALVIGIAVTFATVQTTSDKSTTIYSMANDTFNASTTTGNFTKFKGFNDGSSFYMKISTLHLYNKTDCVTQEFTYGTDYVVLGNGTTPYLNFTNVGNAKRPAHTFTCAVYDYYDITYMSDSTARLIMRLLPLMVVVLLVVACATMLG